MIVGIPRESYPGERRVAIVPAVLPALIKAGLEIIMEAGAGVEAEIGKSWKNIDLSCILAK